MKNFNKKYANTESAINKSNESEDNTGITKNEYCDILSTEDCFEYEVANNIILGYN